METLQAIVQLFLANWPGILCLIVGIVLIGIEIFLPGFGIPGITGIVLTTIGIIILTDSPLTALVLILAILAILGILIAIAIRSAKKGRIAESPLILKEELDKESGFSSASDMEYFVGRSGVAATDLRPSGIADFDGVKLDVVTEGSFLEKGSTLVIISVEGRRIVVRRD
ncbi:MAG: NfeD family protein [Christensenellales bacterium]